MCSFKSIEMNLSVIVFRNNLILSKVKHIKCHQLMCTSIPCTNKRPYCNDMIFKITCFRNDEISILGYTNYLIELNYVIGFTHKIFFTKSNYFFSLLKEECVGNNFYL